MLLLVAGSSIQKYYVGARFATAPLWTMVEFKNSSELGVFGSMELIVSN